MKVRRYSYANQPYGNIETDLKGIGLEGVDWKENEMIEESI
jgi:hypothetical protein